MLGVVRIFESSIGNNWLMKSNTIKLRFKFNQLSEESSYELLNDIFVDKCQPLKQYVDESAFSG